MVARRVRRDDAARHGRDAAVEQRDTVPDMLEMEKRFREPIAVEVDEENRIMIVDCRRDRIQVYKKVS